MLGNFGAKLILYFMFSGSAAPSLSKNPWSGSGSWGG